MWDGRWMDGWMDDGSIQTSNSQQRIQCTPANTNEHWTNEQRTPNERTNERQHTTKKVRKSESHAVCLVILSFCMTHCCWQRQNKFDCASTHVCYLQMHSTYCTERFRLTRVKSEHWSIKQIKHWIVGLIVGLLDCWIAFMKYTVLVSPVCYAPEQRIA